MPNIGFSEIAPIVKCLALEEQSYHDQKKSGPMYKLNQDMINLLAIENKLQFNSAIKETVCAAPNKAFTLLKLILLSKKDLFISPKKEQNEWEITFFAQQVGQIVSSNYEVFLNFIASIQMEINSPNCLQQIIPGYSDYLEREKYLKDIQSQYLNKDSLEVMENLLSTISSVDRLKERCKKLKNKK